MGTGSWSLGLEGAALRIAETDDSPLRVTAGPGTGKTFCLNRRVARLLEAGTAPNRILVCTFTRTAARDLKRAVESLGVPGAENVRTSTLHAYCFSVLQRAEVLETTGRVPRPILQFEQRFMLEDLKYQDLGGIQSLRARLLAFNAAWARLQSEQPGWPSDPGDQAFQAALDAWLRFHEAILIGELVPVTLQYFRNNPGSSDLRAFDHVLVDEYQDLNKSEQVLLDFLSARARFAVIGDEDQSIYSFKHAHPEGISTFHETHQGTVDEELAICRRCPPNVLEIARQLISHNASRTDRELHPQDGLGPGEIFLVQWPSMEDESTGLARFIRGRIDRGEVTAGQVLVLAPRRQFGYSVRNALNAAGVLSMSFFTEEAFDGAPSDLHASRAQQAFSLLTLLANPDDRVALRCWCGFGSPSLRAGAWARLRGHCETSGDSPREALERLVSGDLQLPTVASLVSRYQELQAELDVLADVRSGDLVDVLFPASEDWVDPFRSLAATIEDEDFGPTELHESLLVGLTQPELPTDVDYVRVMSLHKSKGLTADMVIITGCIEGLIPSHDDRLRGDEAARFAEEQRRLFYVAITRPRKTLVLSSVTRLLTNLAYKMRARIGSSSGTNCRTIASTFISELGPTAPATITGQNFLEVTNE